ncbi:hypothetical protein AMELA_G00247350 [Ameiurus melas]|uniref:Uncharacterized protein n=1 Tax=Ameiurus melas TaxID=219545 RepID=A0A7J5ZTJ6_AMEME|nr:hypothetical protein AMELA_G00247350 [Ameiurus melas]
MSCVTRATVNHTQRLHLRSSSNMCPHYSLKIPPKKRRRSSKTFKPLSHGSPLSLQLIAGETHLPACPFCCIFTGPKGSVHSL